MIIYKAVDHYYYRENELLEFMLQMQDCYINCYYYTTILNLVEEEIRVKSKIHLYKPLYKTCFLFLFYFSFSPWFSTKLRIRKSLKTFASGKEPFSDNSVILMIGLRVHIFYIQQLLLILLDESSEDLANHHTLFPHIGIREGWHRNNPLPLACQR